jgi:hypothetical protein
LEKIFKAEPTETWELTELEEEVEVDVEDEADEWNENGQGHHPTHGYPGAYPVGMANRPHSSIYICQLSSSLHLE